MMPDYHALIVGAGFSGIGAAIKLDRAGFSDYLVVEAGDGVGGTWHWNTYPGIAVDIPSFSYQFSFEQSRHWSRTYAPGHELKAYAEHCVDKYGIRSRIRLNTKVLAAEFDDEHSLWRVQTDPGGEITARFLISACGILTVPKLPDIDGVDSFEGVTMHTARWDHTQDLTGKRVGIIGTGASAAGHSRDGANCLPPHRFSAHPYLVFPQIRRSTAHSRPLGDADSRRQSRPPAAQPGLRGSNVPHRGALLRGVSVGQAHGVSGTALPAPTGPRSGGARATHPRYAVGCKRPGFHNTYLSTFNRDNVRLVTEPIDKITPTAVATTDGASHEIDVLVLATGFKVLDTDSIPTYAVTGTGGASLSRFWDEHRLQAYEGVSVPGYPNFFTVFGPYGYVGSSYFALIETQAHHIIRCLKRARRTGATRIEVTEEANARYFAEVMRRRHRQVFWQDSCRLANSYYFDKNGDVPLRPTTTVEAYWRSRRFDLGDYRISS